MEQQNRLSHLETVIARNQGHFCDIGRALNEIRKNRLYKLALFETFEAYTRTRWDMGRAYAYRLIKSYEVVCNLSPIGDILPANECQVRPLAQLELIEQRKVWQGFLNSGMEITALNIKKFIGTRTVDNLKVRPKNDPVDLTDQISDEYMAAVQQVMEQVRMAQHDHWQQTSRQAALLWNRVIREKILSKGTGNG
ncbi:MAG: DNA methylase [Deltaproteobacteria bacterium]|nr:MAG: DNA methylase [Deltaproteobacteria bacterium]